jgi:adenylate cyclase
MSDLVQLCRSLLQGPYLEAEIGGELRQFALADNDMFRIGRSDKNEVVIADELASRQHAMLQRSEEGMVYLTDLGSSNGTFVNGARVSTPVILRSGDLISIGNHEFRFHQEVVQPPPAEEPDQLRATNLFFKETLITVLVVDICDFTRLSQRIDAAKLSKLMGTFFREGGKVLEQRGAFAQKYIGDAIMAIWLHKKRAPEREELYAIFDGLSQLVAITAGLQQQFELQTPISIGAGINTGWASVGNVGSIALSNYTALGDVVNKTFRLESSTRQCSYELMLGPDTYKRLADTFDTSMLFEFCSMFLKGYDEPVTAYGADFSSLSSVLEGLTRTQRTQA